jgi:hypothetical protein
MRGLKIHFSSLLIASLLNCLFAFLLSFSDAIYVFFGSFFNLFFPSIFGFLIHKLIIRKRGQIENMKILYSHVAILSLIFITFIIIFSVLEVFSYYSFRSNEVTFNEIIKVAKKEYLPWLPAILVYSFFISKFEYDSFLKNNFKIDSKE